MDASEMKEAMRKQMAKSVEEVERGEDLLPCFIGFNDAGEVFIMGTPWDSEEDKVRTLRYVTLFFAWKQVTSYIQVSEAWTVTREIDDQDRRAPADCEDRSEVIVVNGVTRSGAWGLISRIARDGKLAACSDPDWGGDGTMTGRMMRLLPPEGMGPPPPHVEAELRAVFAHFSQGGAG
jgi:hypothetical protein